MRDILLRFDFCSYLVVGVCAYVIARRAGQFLPRFTQTMWWTAMAVLLSVAGYAYIEVRPVRPFEILGIAIIAGIAACVAALATAVILPPLAWVLDSWRTGVDRRKAEAEQRLREEQQRLLQEQAERARWERAQAAAAYRRSVPPPPTRQEKAQAVRQRYEETLRLLEGADLDDLERKAARDQAKQKYLRELDGLVE
jgi:hypothetical protein